MSRLLAIIAALAIACTSSAAAVPLAEPADSLPEQGRRADQAIRQRIAEADWGRIAATTGLRVGLKLGIDATLKKNVHEWRPDGSDTHSFPSRHSTWAFGVGCTIGYELGIYSPWWAVGAHAVADGVGMQRVMSRRHWPGDVMAGAGIGIATDLLSRRVGDAIFGYKSNYPDWKLCRNEFSRSLTVSTAAEFPLAQDFGPYGLGTALVSRVRYAMPLSGSLGLSASAALSAAPVKTGGINPWPLNSIFAGIGPAWHWQISDGPFAIGASAEAGYVWRLGMKHIDVGAGSAAFNASLQATIKLTSALSIGAEAGYGISSLRLGSATRTLSSISVGFSSRASF